MDERLADVVVLYKRLSREVNIYIDTLLPKKNNRPKQTSSSGSLGFELMTTDDTTYDIQNEERKYYSFNAVSRISDKMVSYFDKQDDIDDILALKEVLMESTDYPDKIMVSIKLMKYLSKVGDIINRKFEEDKNTKEKQLDFINTQSEQIKKYINDTNARISPTVKNRDTLANHTTFGIKDKGFNWDEIYDYLMGTFDGDPDPKERLEGSWEAFLYAMTGEGTTPREFPYLKWLSTKSEFALFLRGVIGVNRIEQFKTAVYIFSSSGDCQAGRYSCRIVDDEKTRKQIIDGDMVCLLDAATRLRDSTRIDKIIEQSQWDGNKLLFFEELSPAFKKFVDQRPGLFDRKN